jgi:predicted RNA-binding protein with PUA-like domain
MANWILKTEPSSYSFDRLQAERTATWDGVTNALALKHLRSMRQGDGLMIYHTGDEKQIVGLAEVVSAPYPDPKAKDAKLVVVDVRAKERLPRAVPLSAVRSEPTMADMALVRMPRLSVVPVTAAQWALLLKLGGV